MTKIDRPASGQEAGRGNEQANNGSHPNTAGPRAQVYRDPITKKVILRTRRTQSGLFIVDLECEEALFFAHRLFPAPTHKISRSGRKPWSRWVYRVRP